MSLWIRVQRANELRTKGSFTCTFEMFLVQHSLKSTMDFWYKFTQPQTFPSVNFFFLSLFSFLTAATAPLLFSSIACWKLNRGISSAFHSIKSICLLKFHASIDKEHTFLFIHSPFRIETESEVSRTKQNPIVRNVDSSVYKVPGFKVYISFVITWRIQLDPQRKITFDQSKTIEAIKITSKCNAQHSDKYNRNSSSVLSSSLKCSSQNPIF